MASQAVQRLDEEDGEDREDLLQDNDVEDDAEWEAVDEAALRDALFVASQETEKLDPFRIFDDQPYHRR